MNTPHKLRDHQMRPHAQEIYNNLTAFMREVFIPHEHLYFEALKSDRWRVPEVMETWKREARAQNLWNLFLPDDQLGAGLTHWEYAQMAEVMGRSLIASEIFNCSAPDTGKMEVLWRYGSSTT